MLPIRARSNKTAKEGAARKHLAARSWKLIRNTDINISSSTSTALTSVENLHPLDADSGAVVNGKPGFGLMLGMAHFYNASIFIRGICVSINAFLCSKVG